MMELFKLYKYTTKVNKIYYNIGLAFRGTETLCIEYDNQKKRWGGIIVVPFYRVKQTSLKTFPFSILENKEYYELIEKIFREEKNLIRLINNNY